MQVQLAFRESARTLGRRRVSMVAGFISTHPGTLPAEGIVALDITTGADGALTGLGPIQSSYQPDQMHLYGDHFANEMGSFVTQSIWQIPKGADTLLLYCREIRMAADDPLIGQAYAVEGLLALADPGHPDFDRISVFSGSIKEGMPLKGFLGQDVRSEWNIPPIVEATRGSSLAQFFKMPLWGWGAEPVGMIATMHPRVCDALDEYRWKPQAAWRPGLERKLGQWGLLPHRDEQFIQVLNHIRSSYPGFLENRSSAGTQTQEEIDLMASRMREAVTIVLDRERETPSP